MSKSNFESGGSSSSNNTTKCRYYTHIYRKSGVVAYPVMQVYGSLALEDNSEVGEVEQGRSSILCVCTSAFLPPDKEVEPQEHAMGPIV